MRLLYLVSEYPKVSHSFVRREIEALEAMGHQVDRLSIRGWDLPLADPADVRERSKTKFVLEGGLVPLLGAMVKCILTKPGATLKALRLALRMGKRADKAWPLHIIYWLEACWIACASAGKQYDHLHAHFGTNPAEVATLVNALTGLPYSFTAHGPEEFDKPETLHLREKVAHSAFVVTVSSYGRSQMMRWARHQDWGKVKVVHCGIDSTFLDGAQTPVPSAPRLVCVARLSGQKGQLILLEAAALVKQRGLRFELVLAGDGEMRPEVEAKIAALDLADTVRITGWISGAQVKDELLGSRALVLPSFAEGLPVVIMEAMALGRPVLSTYIAGIPELVQTGQTGWLFPAGDVLALADVMQSCLEADTQALTEMGTKARVRVAERHSAATEAKKLAGFITSSKG